MSRETVLRLLRTPCTKRELKKYMSETTAQKYLKELYHDGVIDYDVTKTIRGCTTRRWHIIDHTNHTEENTK